MAIMCETPQYTLECNFSLLHFFKCRLQHERNSLAIYGGIGAEDHMILVRILPDVIFHFSTFGNYQVLSLHAIGLEQICHHPDSHGIHLQDHIQQISVIVKYCISGTGHIIEPISRL